MILKDFQPLSIVENFGIVEYSRASNPSRHIITVSFKKFVLGRGIKIEINVKRNKTCNKKFCMTHLQKILRGYIGNILTSLSGGMASWRVYMLIPLIIQQKLFQ